MDVEQDKYVVDQDEDVVETCGLGPCIGVAIIYQDRVSLIHTSGAIEVPDFRRFCEEVADVIPPEARAYIRPIVAGGEFEYPPEHSERKRDFVIATLQDMGFGSPQTEWCPKHHTQTIFVDCEGKEAVIESYNRLTGKDQPTIPLEF